MIEVKELRIIDCDGKLVIDVSISPLPYYNDVYFDQIIIDTQDTHLDNNNPSATPVYQKIIEGNQKAIRLELDSLDLGSVKDTLFFVYIITKGTPSSDTPCGMDNNTNLKVVTDLKPIYDKAMKFLAEVNNNCDIPGNLMDFIFKLQGFDLAIKTCNFNLAKKFWTKYFKNPTYFTDIISNCGCK